MQARHSLTQSKQTTSQHRSWVHQNDVQRILLGAWVSPLNDGTFLICSYINRPFSHDVGVALKKVERRINPNKCKIKDCPRFGKPGCLPLYVDYLPSLASRFPEKFDELQEIYRKLFLDGYKKSLVPQPEKAYEYMNVFEKCKEYIKLRALSDRSEIKWKAECKARTNEFEKKMTEAREKDRREREEEQEFMSRMGEEYFEEEIWSERDLYRICSKDSWEKLEQMEIDVNRIIEIRKKRKLLGIVVEYN